MDCVEEAHARRGTPSHNAMRSIGKFACVKGLSCVTGVSLLVHDLKGFCLGLARRNHSEIDRMSSSPDTAVDAVHGIQISSNGLPQILIHTGSPATTWCIENDEELPRMNAPDQVCAWIHTCRTGSLEQFLPP